MNDFLHPKKDIIGSSLNVKHYIFNISSVCNESFLKSRDRCQHSWFESSTFTINPPVDVKIHIYMETLREETDIILIKF